MTLDAEELWQRIVRAVASVPDSARTPPEGARVGAVLALLEAGDDGPRILVTRRRTDMSSHPGQLSFPGGRIDAGETPEQAALREAHEEVGLDPATVELGGVGPTFYIPPSRFWVVPVIGRWTDPHPLEPNPWEVDEVLHVPVADLLEEERWRFVPLADRGAMWAWQLEDDLLWGATAMMVATLLDVAVEGWSGGRGPRDLGSDREVRPWEGVPVPTPRHRLEGVPEVPIAQVPVVPAAAVRAIDAMLREDANVGLAQLLEHAGRAVSDAVRRLAGGDLAGVDVTVLVGPGGNGAGGLATARLLGSAGARVAVVPVDAGAAPEEIERVRALGIEVVGLEEGALPGDVVVDAMLGIGGRPPAEGGVAEAIAWLQRHDVRTVAVDLPSGMDPDEGVRGACVAADVTIALGAPKPAHRAAISSAYLGDLYLADLGIPAHIWRRAGYEPVEVFGRGPLVRLVRD